MVITPDSKVKLIKNPLKLDSNNEITFTSASAQYNYFNSLPKLEFDNLTYIRKDNILRIETDDNLTFEDLLGYNFCMYQNTHFDNKWFYAFITDVTWINPGLTELKLETAYFQTWQFDLVYMDSFIEREHVDNDTIGLHTIPEDLDTGDYIVDFKKSLTDLTAYKFILAVNIDFYIDSTTGVVTISGGDNGGGIYNGVKTAYRYYYFNNGSVSKLSDVIKAYASAGKLDAIGMIFTAPTMLINKQDPTATDNGDIVEDYDENTFNWADSIDSNNLIHKPFTLNGYTPKNNKLLCYPYQYLLMSNNNGGNAIYKYELFETDASDNHLINFQVKSAICPSMSGFIVPYLYNRSLGFNFEEKLQLPKFPICGWSSDVYTNWLTQQGINNVANIVKSTGTGATGGATLGPAGMLLGGMAGMINATGNIIMEMKNHEFVPAQANGNTNVGDVNLASNLNTFTAYGMCIKEEYARVIDGFLSMFGYKVNRVGTPHINARTYYDYIKTNGVNIEGNIPENDLEEIRKLFNNGIRFWHNTQNYLDFSVNNTIR